MVQYFTFADQNTRLTCFMLQAFKNFIFACVTFFIWRFREVAKGYY